MSRDNKNIVDHWFREFWGHPWNPEVIADLGAPDILVRHSTHEPRRGRADVTRFMVALRAAFPDLHVRPVGDLIAEGSRVVSRWEGGGTHTGSAYGGFRMGDLPAGSGRTLHFTGTTIFRLEHCRIVEDFGQSDALTAMLQIGLCRPRDAKAVPLQIGGSLPFGWNRLASAAEIY